ncbi:hypothetical protein TUM4438_41450 [Shewanella sairae]|uniref:Uncharacterized protein n=1 Tax=Shewanella sairae TaxID=190310 RepID=A0ABQ4PQW3_9GAMM|nr:hypothetical protein [Shewanella sairae]MCL1132369.1 hypothetical protein [Shewanella sairae]GIU51526.1 hypothetical protein TUM4438_41450 [Shewanella sairae]
MTQERLSIEAECLAAECKKQRTYTSYHRCDGCNKETPSRYAVSGQCVTCKGLGTKNTTDTRNYWCPGYHDKQAFKASRVASLMLQVFNERQRERILIERPPLKYL